MHGIKYNVLIWKVVHHFRLAENVTNLKRGTVLSKGTALVSTVEHAMAALYALGVDNCLIEVDAPEFYFSGSSIKRVLKPLIKLG